MKTITLLLAILYAGISSLHATPDTLYPEAGKPCPDFLLKNVAFYNRSEVTPADFEGKWLVLDFWNKYCSSCIETFPKVNAMQKKFGDRVQFILVGIQDAENKIRTMYERFRKRYELDIPCAFDSALSDYWGIYSTPQIIIVDDKGIVRAVTYKLDSTDMETFLQGQEPDLPISYYAQRKNGPDVKEQKIPFDIYRPFMVSNNGAKSDANFLFRSVLTKWDQASQIDSYATGIDLHSIDSTYPKGTFQVMAVSLQQLYMYAYIGKPFWEATDTAYYARYADHPVIETKDKAPFQTTATENRYCYSLIMPPFMGTTQNMQRAMQRDLATYFGYDIAIETRKLPCWQLTATQEAAHRLKTKGGKENIEALIPYVSYKFSNTTMTRLMQYLASFTNDPIIDKTGITNNIDFTSDFIDLDAMKKYLPKYGLQLIPAEKEMKVLVIRDAKN